MFTFTKRFAGRLATMIAATGFLLAVSTGNALAVTITSASWNGTTLSVSGTGDKSNGPGGAGPVVVYNAADDSQLASTNVGGSGSWSASSSTCAANIYAVQNGQQTPDFAVDGANCGGGGNQPPTCTINTPTSNPVNITTGSSVQYTGTATDNDGTIVSYSWIFQGGSPANSSIEDPGTVTYNTAGTFTTTFEATDDQGAACNTASRTINVTAPGEPPPPLPTQTDYKMLMNYELGMHCTGFEFAYCCVLPVYNSILAQIVKPETSSSGTTVAPHLLEGDPGVGLDGLGRETVLREKALDANGDFKKYVVRYWHEAQPRNDGRGKAQGPSRLISNVEGNSLFAWNTVFDSAKVVGGALQYGNYNGATGVMQGDDCPDGITDGCTPNDPSDNYQNAVWNHLYFYSDLEGTIPGGTSAESSKIRLGVSGQPIMDVVYPENTGAALHPMGPIDPDDPTAGSSGGPFDNVLTFSGETGTVVYTQMKVLENLPVMLTSPDIWEALGLPLTPFEDSIDFFADPGLVDEDSIRPYVQMKAQLWTWDANVANQTAVLDGSGEPVIGFGTAPIDIPNCERCHSNPPNGTMIPNPANEGNGMLQVANSPNDDATQWAMVQDEYNFWNAYYDIDTGAGDSDWYSRLKSAAISMLWAHDQQHGTSFTSHYPACTDSNNPSSCGVPQNTRLGHEAVICQRCHADNVIAVVKSANCDASNPLCSSPGALIMPITEAMHNNHDGVVFSDVNGRDGACQGCHPAHRSDGDMMGYPITVAGTNLYATSDNRDANGGCFVGRDVHSNPGKDTDGAETPQHLNAVGAWLSQNVFQNQGSQGNQGIWCTNCHTQLGQEIWKAENCADLVHGDCVNDVRNQPSLAAVASAVGVSTNQAIAWLDPNNVDLHGTGFGDLTNAIWASDPGLCDYVDNELGTVLGGGLPSNQAHDGNVATIEVHVGGTCSAGYVDGPTLPCGTAATLCGKFDGDGDFSVHILDFCTTPDCVTAAQSTLTTSLAVPVPFSAATDGRDHWLAAGEPHCADCHAAPYVEQSGNINAFPPFNYPRKASLMRYSKGHQGITCQGCHESIHGLYPVTPFIDTTSYAQAASLNDDGSHGPLKCGTCHSVGSNEIPSWVRSGLMYTDPVSGLSTQVSGNFDAAVSWMHTYTDETLPTDSMCLNCHGVKGNNWDLLAQASTNTKWIQHTYRGRASREAMDKVELKYQGHVSGDMNAPEDPYTTVCVGCHRDRSNKVACNNSKWKNHLIEGRVSEIVWEQVSEDKTTSTCGW